MAATRAAPVAVSTKSNIRKITRKIASRSVSSLRVYGAAKAIVAGCRAIAIASFTRLHHVIRANRGAITVVQVIAAGRTASVIIRAGSNVETGAMGVASSRRSVYGVGGAGVGVVASGWAIVIAKFIGLDNAVATGGLAVVVCVGVASGWAAIIVTHAGHNRTVKAQKVAGCGTSRGIILGAGIVVPAA